MRSTRRHRRSSSLLVLTAAGELVRVADGSVDHSLLLQRLRGGLTHQPGTVPHTLSYTSSFSAASTLSLWRGRKQQPVCRKRWVWAFIFICPFSDFDNCFSPHCPEYHYENNGAVSVPARGFSFATVSQKENDCVERSGANDVTIWRRPTPIVVLFFILFYFFIWISSEHQSRPLQSVHRTHCILRSYHQSNQREGEQCVDGLL